MAAFYKALQDHPSPNHAIAKFPQSMEQWTAFSKLCTPKAIYGPAKDAAAEGWMKELVELLSAQDNYNTVVAGSTRDPTVFMAKDAAAAEAKAGEGFIHLDLEVVKAEVIKR